MTETLRKSWQERCAEFCAKRDEWMQTKYPWWNTVMSVLNGAYIVPSDRYRGEEFTGSWIHPLWRKYSLERVPKQGATEERIQAMKQTRLENLEKAKADDKGLTSEELATQVCDAMGMTTRDAEETLIEAFRHLKKRELNAELKEEGRTEKTHEQTENRVAQLECGESPFAKLNQSDVSTCLKKLSVCVDENGKSLLGTQGGMRRVDWMDRMFAEGKLELSKTQFKNKDGKRSCMVNGQLVHELVYKYGQHLMKGGASFSEAVRLFNEKRDAQKALWAMQRAADGGIEAELQATGTDDVVPF